MVEKLAGVTQQKDYGSSDAGARFNGNTRLEPSPWGFLCLPCLPACLPTQAPLSPPPGVLCTPHLVEFSPCCWQPERKGERRRRVAVGREIHPDGGIRGPPQEAWSW